MIDVSLAPLTACNNPAMEGYSAFVRVQELGQSETGVSIRHPAAVVAALACRECRDPCLDKVVMWIGGDEERFTSLPTVAAGMLLTHSGGMPVAVRVPLAPGEAPLDQTHGALATEEVAELSWFSQMSLEHHLDIVAEYMLREAAKYPPGTKLTKAIFDDKVLKVFHARLPKSQRDYIYRKSLDSLLAASLIKRGEGYSYLFVQNGFVPEAPIDEVEGTSHSTSAEPVAGPSTGSPEEINIYYEVQLTNLGVSVCKDGDKLHVSQGGKRLDGLDDTDQENAALILLALGCRGGVQPMSESAIRERVKILSGKQIVHVTQLIEKLEAALEKEWDIPDSIWSRTQANVFAASTKQYLLRDRSLLNGPDARIALERLGFDNKKITSALLSSI